MDMKIRNIFVLNNFMLTQFTHKMSDSGTLGITQLNIFKNNMKSIRILP